MKTRRVVLAVTVIILILILVFLALAVAPARGSSPLTNPQLGGVGGIKAVAAVDANTVFAVVSNAVGMSGFTSHIVKTTDGGTTWLPTGNFSTENPNRPSGLNYVTYTSFILMLSPNYAQDKTVFVAVVVPGYSNQVYRSQDGGSNFSLLGGVYFSPSEIIKAMAITPQGVVVGTINPVDGVGGNLYLFQNSWKRVVMGMMEEDELKPVHLDFYALGFCRGQLVAIATPDTLANEMLGLPADQSFYEYRLGIPGDTIILPRVRPFKIKLEGVNQYWDESVQSFSLGFPSDWSPGTDKDTNFVSYSGENSGFVLRHEGTNGGYSFIRVSNASISYGNVIIQGTSKEAKVCVSGQGTNTGSVLFFSGDNGANWASVSSGPSSGIDGFGTPVITLSGGVLYVGTSGPQGGVFKTSISPSYYSWKDTSLYTNTYSMVGMASQDSTLIMLAASSSVTGAIFKTVDNGVSWERIKRITDWGVNLYASKFTVFPDQTIYLFLGTGYQYYPGQILKTSNRGNSWTTATYPGSTVTLGIGDQNVLVAQLTDNTVCYSWDGGVSWKSSDFSPPERLKSITPSTGFSKDGTFFGKTWGGNIYVSRDKGKTWSLGWLD